MTRHIVVIITVALFAMESSAQTAWTLNLNGADISAELTYGPQAIAIAETIGSTVQLRLVDATTGMIISTKTWAGRPDQTPGERRPEVAALDSGGWLVLIEHRLTLLDNRGSEVRTIAFEREKRVEIADGQPPRTIYQAITLVSNGKDAAVLAHESSHWHGRLYWVGGDKLEATEEVLHEPWPFGARVAMTRAEELLSSSWENGSQVKARDLPAMPFCAKCKRLVGGTDFQQFGEGLLRARIKGKHPVGIFRDEALLWQTGCPNGEQDVVIKSAQDAPVIALLCNGGFGSAWTVVYAEVGSRALQTLSIPTVVTKRRIGSSVVQESEITPRIALSPAGDRLLVLHWPQQTLTSYRIAAH